MPVVPTYNAPQVREQALQPVYQREIDVSSGARALSQGLGQMGDAVDQQLQRDAQAKAFDVENKITADWLKWDSEARAQFRGEKADGYAPAAEAWWKSTAEGYGKDLDPRTRKLASTALSRKQTAALGSVLSFVGSEKERHADDVASANIASTVQFGITTGDVAGAAEQIRSTLAQTGARKGWTTEQLTAATTQELGKLHAARIGQLAESDPSAAQAYYDDAKSRNEIPYASQGRIEQVLKDEGDNQFATQFAAQNATKPYAEQLEAAGSIDDPKRREKTILALKNQHAQLKEAQREQETRFADQAWQLVGQGKRVPEALLSGMDGRERVQLQEHLRARAERAATGTPVKTDMATYIDVREKLARGEPVNLRAYTEKIGAGQMEQLLDIQSAIGKGGVKQDTVLTDESRINNALLGLGIDKKKNTEAAVAFTTEIDRRVRAESAARGGKDLTADEKQKIIDSVALDKVYVDEWGRDPSTPTVLLTPDQMDDAYVVVGGKQVKLNSIPSTDRSQIIASLKKRRLPATEQAVAEIYMLKKGK